MQKTKVCLGIEFINFENGSIFIHNSNEDDNICLVDKNGKHSS